MQEKQHLILVDGSSYIFRAYHALPPLTRKSDGLPVGAVSGFCNMLFKLLQDKNDDIPDPSHMAVIFDASGVGFRNEIYPDYKGHRPEVPEDLRPQFSIIREAVRAFQLPCIELTGYEADDIIATYAKAAAKQGFDVTIIASDKDLMQLVDDHISMYDTMKNRSIKYDQVVEKFGVAPEKVIDVQALAGDSVDNIPGVPGIGIKTAAQLIDEYGDLENLLQNAHNIKQNKRREKLIENADLARISLQLVTLKQDVHDIPPLDELGIIGIDGKELVAFLKEMEFTTLTNRVAKSFDVDLLAIAPSSRVTRLEPEEQNSEDDKNAVNPVSGSESTPREKVLKITQQMQEIGEARDNYQTITSKEALKPWVNAIFEQGYFAFDCETTSLDAMQADIVGFSMSVEAGQGAYIPVGHIVGETLFAERAEGQMSLEDALFMLKPLLEDVSIKVIGQNLKYDWLVLAQHGVHITAMDDTMLMSYALDAGLGNHGMDALSERHLGIKPISYEEVTGKGKAQINFSHVDIPVATKYAAEDADITLRLWHIFSTRLVAEKMVALYESIEKPMIDCLAKMEQRGIKLDAQILSQLSSDFSHKMLSMEQDIYRLAGHEFNIASPKQLGDILFGEMGLSGGKKTKTGAWSTSAQVLEDLAAEGHELPKNIVAWRGLAKLKSTYSDALPHFINPQTNRVHTSFSLAATTTGRLSSSDPNLQNIPIRSEDGRKIRRAFIAENGMKLISADYSQIELRVLAHVGDVPELKKAFANRLDIHAMTASEMFNTPIEGMDPMIRRQAKAINFGIIYGISAFGLAAQLGISRTEAKDYIDLYFKRFPGIKDYMEETKKQCREQGYVETIFGRKAHYPMINSKNPAERAFNERAAINAPIQGSAADILRRAMVRMDEALKQSHLSAQMLLQVHDELIFETHESEMDQSIALITKVMEEATLPRLQLSVPLEVEAKGADNWDDAH